jgi:hypothetical protein
MPYGSGLSAQVGIKAETTYGTPVTVTQFPEFLSESLSKQITYLDSAGIKAGQAYKRASRVVQSRSTVNGNLVMEASDKGLGTWIKHALGSTVTTPTQIGATTAYKQIHTPGSKAAMGLTVQVGRAETGATVKPFTYAGCKISKWEFTVSDGEIAKFTFDVDGRSMATATALATASFTADTGVFNFSDVASGAFKIGGTASTAAGETTISSGTAVTSLVKGITISGESPMATERYGIGNAGLKGEPIENDTPTITGSFDTEFTSQAEFYDFYNANTSKALEIPFAHGDAGTSNPFLLSFIIPVVKFKAADVNVGGPDIIPQKVDWEAYDDGVNPVIQVKIVSTDSAAL